MLGLAGVTNLIQPAMTVSLRGSRAVHLVRVRGAVEDRRVELLRSAVDAPDRAQGMRSVIRTLLMPALEGRMTRMPGW